jgi:AcrR family transcriptional regulator
MTGPNMAPNLISSPQERREQMRAAMRAAILEAALLVMRERGVAALSLREVARRVQLQVSSLYEYYPSKAALYDALFLLGVDRYGEYKDRVAAQRFSSFWDRVTAWLTIYMQFAQENPELYQLAFERPVPGFTPSEDSLAASTHMLLDFEQSLQTAQAEGWIRQDVLVVHARDLLIAMMHGLTSQHMANEPHLPIGSGRYGTLIAEAVELFHVAWEAPFPIDAQPDGPPGGTDLM